MLKPIAALEGDVVEQTSDGLRVNGRLLPGSLALSADTRGVPLPRLFSGRLVINKSEIFLVSGHERSFDGRYFGPLPLSAVKGIAVPKWSVAQRIRIQIKWKKRCGLLASKLPRTATIRGGERGRLARRHL